MDELLYERVKQLKEIEDRLDLISRGRPDQLLRAVQALRDDLKMMVLEAERQHAEF